MDSGPIVTVVVPTRNAERTLARCLASIRAQTYPQIELVVVDNSPGPGTLAIAHQFADIAVAGGPERSAQRNQGRRAGHGEYIVFIDADMVLSPQVVSDIVQSFVGDPGLGAVVLPELAFGEGFLAQCRELEKQLYLGDARVEAARAFPSRVLDEVGDYDEDVTGSRTGSCLTAYASPGTVWPHRRGGAARRRPHQPAPRVRQEALLRAVAADLPASAAGRSEPVGSARAVRATRSRPAQPGAFCRPAVLKTVEWTGLLLGALESSRRAGL